MKTILSQSLYELEKKNSLCIVTIIGNADSSPRKAGSCMLVGERGRITGTIGGGRVELLAEERAIRLISEERSEVVDYALKTDSSVPGSIGMACGGDVTVAFTYIPGTSEAFAAAAAEGKRACEEGEGAYVFFPLTGDAVKIVSDASVPGNGEIIRTEDGFYYCLPRKERAIIFGGGHISAALCPILASVGFSPVIYDCREEYSNPARFPTASETICRPYEEIEKHLSFGENDYIVIMTNGHSYDYECEKAVLNTGAAYIGVIGSKKKTAAINAKLREAGADEETLASVHTPIGLSIKAVTPEEIAVSVAAEMILVRAEKREGLGIGEAHHCPMH
ncbi:MAG: XdhC family protein [Oscillospiraceae bacterium]|nr:XdhC family protein [Oscillospiraceae bacterium]